MIKTEEGIQLTEEETVELMKTGYVVDNEERYCVVDQGEEYLVFERKQFTQLSIYDFLEEKWYSLKLMSIFNV